MMRGDEVAAASERRVVADRLRVIEGQLALLLRAAEVREDQRDLQGEIRDAYRRGYLNGYNAGRRRAPAYPNGDAPTGRPRHLRVPA